MLVITEGIDVHMSIFCLSAFAFVLFFFVIFILCAYQWSPREYIHFLFFIPIACSLDSGHTKSILMNIFTKTQTYIKITKMRLWLCNGKNKNKEMGAEQRTPEAVFLLFLFAEKHKKYCEHFVYSTKMIHLCQTHWKHKRPTHRMCAWCMLYKCFTREHHRQ